MDIRFGPVVGSMFKQGKDWGLWFRVCGYGLTISTLKPMFSERNGHTKIVTIFGVKIKVLKP